MSWYDLDNQRSWNILLALGIFLNIVVCFTSDLGLDTHVRMAADEEGMLPWGSTRPIDTEASNPDDLGRVSAPISYSSMQVKMISFSITMVLILIAWMIDNRLASLISIYPTFIFSNGRGYQEGAIAITAAVGFLFLFHRYQSKTTEKKSVIERWDFSGEPPSPILSIMAGIVLVSIVQWKGYLDNQLVIIGGLCLGLVTYYLMKSRILSKWQTSTMKKGIIVYILATIAFFILGFLGYGGSLNVIKDEPLRLLSAYPFAVLDVLVIHLAFGMMIWPFIKSLGVSLNQNTEESVTWHFLACVFVAAFLTAYVAAQWTLESILWSASWPGIIWTMGNNGRYVSLLMIPIFILIIRLEKTNPQQITLQKLSEEKKPMALAIILVLPLSIFASFHGQTMWTDDAADFLAEQVEDGDEFLLIHDQTLGMHWLYTMHNSFVQEDLVNVTGHWRSPDSGWQEELNQSEIKPNRGDISSIEWLVMAPGLEGPSGEWEPIKQGQADFLNGGGEWSIFKRNISQ